MFQNCGPKSTAVWIRLSAFDKGWTDVTLSPDSIRTRAGYYSVRHSLTKYYCSTKTLLHSSRIRQVCGTVGTYCGWAPPRYVHLTSFMWQMLPGLASQLHRFLPKRANLQIVTPLGILCKKAVLPRNVYKALYWATQGHLFNTFTRLSFPEQQWWFCSSLLRIPRPSLPRSTYIHFTSTWCRSCDGCCQAFHITKSDVAGKEGLGASITRMTSGGRKVDVGKQKNTQRKGKVWKWV